MTPAAILLSAALLGGAGDHDGDGLVDAREAELAEAAKPWLVFDSHENARREGEPFIVYQVRPIGERKPLRVRVTYLLLWQWDGGYGPASWCADRHKGDNQPVRVDLRSDDGGWNFAIEKLQIWGFEWPKHAASFAQGSHFVLQNSAGKHHFFFDTTFDKQRSPYSKWGCRENVDGKGASFLPALSGNVGEPERPFEPPLPFAGESAWGTTPFCGGLACARDNPTSKNADAWAR